MRSRSRSSVELALVALALARGADACPCGAPAGAAPALTAVDERVAVRAAAGWSHELGTFDERARAWPLPRGVSTDRATLDLAVAWRAIPSLELSLAASGAWSRAAQPGTVREGISLGDSTLRARWELAPPISPGLPAMALWAGLRAPTGERGDGASALTGVGLGHWELSVGAEARWRVAPRWELSAAAELGARAPATWSGATVVPGPRGLLVVAAVWRPASSVAISAAINAWLEAAPWIDGAQRADAGAYRLGPSVGLSWQCARAVRALASVAADPRVDGFGANGSAELRASLGLIWATPAR